MLRNILPGAAWAPYRAPTRPLAPDTDCESDANEKEENCLKGFVVAICLEGATALGAFGLWHVWHLIR
jgi:hypothetical protein